jgi:hypothetical protein
MLCTPIKTHLEAEATKDAAAKAINFFCISFFCFAGRSRLGLRGHGVGSPVSLDFYDCVALWHVLDSLRGSSTVSSNDFA